MHVNDNEVHYVYRIAKKRFDNEERSEWGKIERTGGRAILEAMYNFGMVNEDWELRPQEPSEGMMNFWRIYAEAVTDVYEVMDSLDLEEGENPMERAAQEFCKMAERGMWEELAQNLANATIYAN